MGLFTLLSHTEVSCHFRVNLGQSLGHSIVYNRCRAIARAWGTADQPHIALAELVKNSYDVDAATCKIIFGLDSIQIIDDGKGVSFNDFRDFWMRIGTTHKIDQRYSNRLNRPLTGSKGVGRLAVQFLADEMTIGSA